MSGKKCLWEETMERLLKGNETTDVSKWLIYSEQTTHSLWVNDSNTSGKWIICEKQAYRLVRAAGDDSSDSNDSSFYKTSRVAASLRVPTICAYTHRHAQLRENFPEICCHCCHAVTHWPRNRAAKAVPRGASNMKIVKIDLVFSIIYCTFASQNKKSIIFTNKQLSQWM